MATGRIGWSRVVELMAHGPRRVLGLPARHLVAGSVADLTIVDPEARVEVTPEWIASKSRNSAFLGHKLLGKATEVLVGGRFVVRGGKVVV